MQSNPEKPTLLGRSQAARPLRFQIDRQTVLLLGVFVVLVVFFGVRSRTFLTSRSITSMAFQLPELGVLALAMIMTIISGGINLSVNATSNLAAVLAGLFLVRLLPHEATPDQATLYVVIALLLMLAIGVLTGIINGLLIGYIGVPPILATLATMTFFTGISTGITGGKTVTGFPDQVSVIGSKTLAGIPIPFVIFVIVTIIAYLLLFQTSFGFKIRMMGANPTAASFTGIDNKAIIMKVYIVSGVFAAVTGILVMSRTMSAAIEYGSTTYVLLAILISVLANITPGFGNVFNVFMAVLILQVLSTGFNTVLLGVSGSSFFKDFSWGVLMILIFVINYFLQGRKGQQE
ncbi:MAG TPA: ABC transporter permease [Aggregatilineaceae bacterium]|nr:ABC transporter permease [Aggregatilineaceae bacterium]